MLVLTHRTVTVTVVVIYLLTNGRRRSVQEDFPTFIEPCQEGAHQKQEKRVTISVREDSIGEV